jgi:hypothetical protein
MCRGQESGDGLVGGRVILENGFEVGDRVVGVDGGDAGGDGRDIGGEVDKALNLTGQSGRGKVWRLVLVKGDPAGKG